MKRFLDRCLHPHGALIAVLAVASALLLSRTLRADRPADALTYFSYLLSTYSLVVLCLWAPGVIRAGLKTLNGQMEDISTGHPWLDEAVAILLDDRRRPVAVLYISLGWNLLYAIFKLVSGALYQSMWFGALGLYYAVLAVMRFSLMRSLHMADKRPDAGLRAYRRTGWALILTTLTMSGVFVQMVVHGQAYDYPGHLIYLMALYAFVKVISAGVGFARHRREQNLTLAAARCISFTCALMSILALQTAMLERFGGQAGDFAFWANALGGAVVTLMMIAICVRMLLRAKKLSCGEAGGEPT